MAATMPPAAEAPRPPCVRPQGRTRPCVRGGARGRAAPRREPDVARKDREAEIALVEGCDSDEEVIEGCSSNFVSCVFGNAMEELLDGDERLVPVDDVREQPAETVERRAEMPPLLFKPSVGTWLLQKPRGLLSEPLAAQDAAASPREAALPRLLPSVGTWLLQKPRGLRSEPLAAQDAAASPREAAPVQPASAAPAPAPRAPWHHLPSVATGVLRKPLAAAAPPPSGTEETPTRAPAAVVRSPLLQHRPSVATWMLLKPKPMACSSSVATVKEPVVTPTAAAPAVSAAPWFLRPSVSTWLLPAPRWADAAPAAAPAAAATEAPAVLTHVAAPEDNLPRFQGDLPRSPAELSEAVTSPTWSHGARRLIFREERRSLGSSAFQAAEELPAPTVISQRSRARLLGPAAALTERGSVEGRDALDRLAGRCRAAPSLGPSAMEMDLRAGSTSLPNPAFSAAGLSMTSAVPMLPNVHKKTAGLEGTTRSNNFRLAGTGIVGGPRTWGVGGR